MTARAGLGQMPALLAVDMKAEYADVPATSDLAAYPGDLARGLFDPLD